MIDQLTIELRGECLRLQLAPYADLPGAVECQHCHLRGLSPDADRCPACGHDVGKERRARGAAAASRAWWRRRLSDLRLFVSAAMAFVLVMLVLGDQPGLFGSDASRVGVALLAVVLFTALTEQCVIVLQVWLQYTAPRWLRAHGFGWVTGGSI